MEDTLASKLNELAKSDDYPFHMPGHKRNPASGRWEQIWPIDITEIDGFDNLHHAQGILAFEQERASRLYGALQSFFLINGSSCGVLSAICATVSENERIILARNSHKSAYHAIDLQRVKVSYVYPQMVSEMLPPGPVMAADVARLMDETGAKVVFITSPTYEGMISDICAISNEVHKRDGILIVDEAHGAHLIFHKAFGKAAEVQGADLVIQSLHKTMPAMTQTALLHVCSNHVDISRIKHYLSIFQTSSPSYVLMASISDCLSLVKQQGKLLFDRYTGRLDAFYDKTKKLRNLQVLDKNWASKAYGCEKDPSKIVIVTEDLVDGEGNPFHGPDLYTLLRETYHLQMEMQMGDYVLAMTSVMDSQEGFDRLWQALSEIDSSLRRIDTKVKTTDGKVTDEKISEGSKIGSGRHVIRPKQVMSLHDANRQSYEILPLCQAIGYMSCEYLYLYPPGIPMITPGELISQEIWEEMQRLMQLGLTIQTAQDDPEPYVRVYKDFIAFKSQK